MTDHPSALVSVPVEPTQGMLRAGRDAFKSSDFHDLDVMDIVRSVGNGAFRHVWSAMLAAAPAAPQAAGVGEPVETISGPLYDLIHFLRPEFREETKTHLARRTSDLLRAPSREPEGGAVDDGAFRIATDLHKAYEQLIYGLPKYLDAENLTDEENMIREAWITLDVTAHRLAALATREEAPAEAGETLNAAEQGRLAAVVNMLEPVAENNETVRLYGKEVAVLLKALRAQPQAREDAQPVGHFQHSATWNAWEEVSPEYVGSDGVVPLYRHPAPDALRETFEDIKSAADSFRDCEGDEVAEQVILRCDQALAALQQGAK